GQARQDILAGLGVEHEQVTALARLGGDARGLAVDLGVEDDDGRRGVVVPQVVGDFLVVPGELAGLGVQRHDRRRVEVLARAVGAGDRGGGVAGPEQDEARLGVDGRRHVDRAAAGALLAPAGADGRDRPEAPQLLAGLGVVGGYEAARALVRTGVADVDL